MKIKHISLFAIVALFVLESCGQPTKETETTSVQELQISEDSLLTKVQYQTFQYFWDGAEPTSGLARERLHLDNIYPSDDREVVTSGGSDRKSVV